MNPCLSSLLFYEVGQGLIFFLCLCLCLMCFPMFQACFRWNSLSLFASQNNCSVAFALSWKCGLRRCMLDYYSHPVAQYLELEPAQYLFIASVHARVSREIPVKAYNQALLFFCRLLLSVHRVHGGGNRHCCRVHGGALCGGPFSRGPGQELSLRVRL